MKPQSIRTTVPVLLAAALAACSSSSGPEIAQMQGKGVGGIRFLTSSLPGDIDKITVTLTGPASITFDAQSAVGTWTGKQDNLKVGKYTVTAQAFVGEEVKYATPQGTSIEATIDTGKTTTITVTLVPLDTLVQNGPDSAPHLVASSVPPDVDTNTGSAPKSATLTVTALDPDKDDVTYSWAEALEVYDGSKWNAAAGAGAGTLKKHADGSDASTVTQSSGQSLSVDYIPPEGFVGRAKLMLTVTDASNKSEDTTFYILVGAELAASFDFDPGANITLNTPVPYAAGNATNSPTASVSYAISGGVGASTHEWSTSCERVSDAKPEPNGNGTFVDDGGTLTFTPPPVVAEDLCLISLTVTDSLGAVTAASTYLFVQHQAALTFTLASKIFDSKHVTAVSADAAPGFGTGSFASDGIGKTDMYFAPLTLFGRPITLGEVKSMSYWTKKGSTHDDPNVADWAIAIYTDKYDNQPQANWYGIRIGAEPYFAIDRVDQAGTWNQWITDAGSNQLRFYESTAGAAGANFGTYTDPDWSTLLTRNALSGVPYAEQPVLLFSIQTGSATAAGLTAQVDGFRVELKDGSVATVNLEP